MFYSSSKEIAHRMYMHCRSNELSCLYIDSSNKDSSSKDPVGNCVVSRDNEL